MSYTQKYARILTKFKKINELILAFMEICNADWREPSERLNSLLNNIIFYLERVPLSVSFTSLNQTEGTLNTLDVYYSNLMNNKTPRVGNKFLSPHDIHQLIDSLIDNFHCYHGLSKGQNLALGKQQIETLSNLYEKKVETATGWLKEVSSTQEELDRRINELQEILNNQIENLRKDFDVFMESRTTLHDDFLAKEYEKFQDSMESIKQVYEGFLSDEKERIRSSIINMTEQSQKHCEEISNAEASCREIEQKLVTLLGIVSNSAISSHYHNRANREGWHSKTCLLFSIIFLGGAAYSIYMGLLPAEPSLPQVILRCFSSLAMLLPGLVLFNEASKRSKNEKTYRDLELCISAVIPSARELPTEKSHAIHEHIARSIIQQATLEPKPEQHSLLEPVMGSPLMKQSKELLDKASEKILNTPSG